MPAWPWLGIEPALDSEVVGLALSRGGLLAMDVDERNGLVERLGGATHPQEQEAIQGAAMTTRRVAL